MSKARNGDGSVAPYVRGGWRARLRYTDDKGQQRRVEKVCRTKAEAVAALRDMRRRAEDGGVVVEDAATLAAYVQRWLDVTLAVSDRAPATKATYETLLRVHVLPTLGSKRLRDLKPTDVERLLLTMGESMSPSTVRQTHTVLRAVLDTAHRDGLVRSNAAAAVQRPRVPRAEARWYTEDEVARMLAAAEGHRYAPLLTVVAYTGLRIGEALALRWSDVTEDEVRVTGSLSNLHRGDTKTRAGMRAVPLVPEAAEAIKARRKAQAAERLAAGVMWTDSGLVFTTEAGTPVDDRNALRWLHGVRRRAGIKGGAWHAFRHAAASRMLTRGVPIGTVQAIMGHSSITVTVDMYGHVTGAHLADEMRRAMSGYGAPHNAPHTAHDAT